MATRGSARLDSKVCSVCKEEKPGSAFSPGRKLADGRQGLSSSCKPCNSEKAMRYRDKKPDTQLNAHLLRAFGITLAEYDHLLDAQNGVCAICGNPPALALGLRSRRQGRAVRPRLVVDHDHETNEVRGLLCTPCNRGIGFLGDDPKRVRAALDYLEDRG